MKPVINYKNKTGKHMNTWRLNSILRGKKWGPKEITVKNKKQLENHEKKNTTMQNL